jgi:hypothetical protein
VAAVTVAVPRVQANVAAPTTTVAATNAINTSALRAEARALATQLRAAQEASHSVAKLATTSKSTGAPQARALATTGHRAPSPSQGSDDQTSASSTTTTTDVTETTTTLPTWSGDDGNEYSGDDGGAGDEWGDR